MKNFYYTKNQAIIDQLNYVESLRRQLLLTPLSPRQELELKWEGITDQICYTLLLNGTVIPKEKIAELLTPEGKKMLSQQEKLVIGCKKTLDYLYHEWLVNDQPITVETLQTVLGFFEIQKIRWSETELTQILNYSQLNNEHPLIQAGVAYVFFYELFHATHELSAATNLFYLLLLYKQGYDMRGMVTIERHLINDSMNYQITITNAIQQQNITLWLEYFTKATAMVLKERLENIHKMKEAKTATAPLFDLNDRQKGILGMLSNPTLRITNSHVQKLYKVSQITASRDLAKLASLGLLLTIGKGRSTQYSKV